MLSIRYVVIALVLVSTLASAQTARPPIRRLQTGVTITGLVLTVQNAAGVLVGTPQTAVWPLPAGSCNRAATVVPPGTVVNPGNVEIDDPALPGRTCLVNFAAYFASFPAATGYKATAQFRYSDGAISGASNVTGPFDEVAAHPAPTGLGVRP